MELLNQTMLKQIIEKIVQEVVREELKKRGEVIDQKCSTAKMLLSI